MLVYRGQVDGNLGLDLPTLEGSFRFPIKYGYASVGRVDAAGPDASGLTQGVLVFVHHPHQSRYVVPASMTVPIPAGIDPEAAVLIANLETAINCTLDARARMGDQVVVFGQGVVGLLITQLLRRTGVQTVVAVDPLPARRQVACEVGADFAIAPDANLRDRVLEITRGTGADLAIEVSGNPTALDAAIDCVRFQGTIVAASWYGIKPVTLHLGGAFHRNRLRIVSSQVSHIDPALAPEWTLQRRLATAVELLYDIDWQPLITHRFAIERAADAYALVDERPAEAIQVLFSYV
jgi:2-desacetyl-2-hydroxyethyl bacteriochlorophyllide A dehydrogenase